MFFCRFWCAFILLLLIAGCGSGDIETVVIRGSDTEVNLVLTLAETYMDRHENVSVAVTGGGSGTGIAALLNKRTDIANSSREFSDHELILAKERDVDVLPIVFALDALTFVTHEDLGIKELSIDQIRNIFTGRLRYWSELGGPHLEISLYGRQSNSGTFSYIQQSILKEDYSSQMKQMNGSSQIIENIKNDKAGIGYVGIGYVVDNEGEATEGLTVLGIKETKNDEAISPLNTENITNGTYPIVRPLYQFLDGKPTGRLKDFLKFELSEEGQKIIMENGYFPVSGEYKEKNREILGHE